MKPKRKHLHAASSTGYIPNLGLESSIRFPNSVLTYRKMLGNDVIHASINTIYSLSSTAKYKLKSKGDSEASIKIKDFIESCFDDMDTSIDDFIRHSLTAYVYGFALSEYTLKYRTSNSSKYDDGLIGIASIQPISQTSISGWKFNENILESYYQRVVYGKDFTINNPITLAHDPLTDIELPVEKLLIVKQGQDVDSPVGVSPLASVYSLYNELLQLQDMRIVSTERNLVGVPYLRAPAAVVSPQDYDQEAVNQNKQLKAILKSATRNREAGLLLPSDYIDGQPAYSFELLKGSTSDTTIIDSAVRDLIFRIHTALGTDYVVLGQASTGSFAMAEAKRYSMGCICDALLQTISSQINRLIDTILQFNNFDRTLAPVFVFESLNKESADTISKTVQRTASVGMLPKSSEVVNEVLASMDLEPLDDGANLDELLTPYTSRSGDGMQTAGNGTSTNNLTDVATLNMA